MAVFEIRNLSFFYPEQDEKAIDRFSLTVEAGEFVVLCGPSGCGKSTLLRQLKPILAPHGRREGELLFEGRPLYELDQRAQSQRIGFVQQSPENQIVTDKVWHELAFGLESLGFDTPTIRRRVAEMASFFGIQTWFYKNVTDLSGGQKQLLNLASVMAMQPSVLILDEPTSQLDPIAASDFLATLGKINRELGTTIILTEHRLEEAFSLASRAVVMDKGALLCEGSPYEVGQRLKNADHSMFLAMPTAMRVWAAVKDDSDCPITVREGRDWLAAYARTHELRALPGSVPDECRGWKPAGDQELCGGQESDASRNQKLGGSCEKEQDGDRKALSAAPSQSCEIAAKAEGLWFKYDKDMPDVVKGLSLEVRKGEFLAILGGNGTGKTTSLKLLAGLLKPYRGEVALNGTMGMLPQNPQALFVKKTVREDLYEILKGKKLPRELMDEKVARVASLCRLEGLMERHPYDLSGGEQQRAALAKVLLLQPDILLMDEPTKGLDAEFKKAFAEIVGELLSQGVTVIMVSHDIEFCAEYAHRCAMFFDGSIVTEGEPRAFFSGNSFYTTSANRMARAFLPTAVTARDVIYACGAEIAQTCGAGADKADQTEAAAANVTECGLGKLNSIDKYGLKNYDKNDRTAGSSSESSSDQPSDNLKEEKSKYVSNKAAPTKLPLWRKALACVSGAVSAVIFLYAISVTDLTSLVSSSGLSELTGSQLRLYAIFIVALFVFAASVTRRSDRPDYLLQQPREKRKLAKRTLVATALILLLIPFTLFVGVYYLGDRKYYFISLLILLETMAPFFLIFEGRKPQARELVVIAVLCAIGVAGRAAFFMLPNFKPVMAITIIAGVAFGGETGFLVGAVTMLTSNVLFSQGPWTPWQMFAMGIIGFLAGVLFRKGILRRGRTSLCVFGALCAIVIYGGIMNPASALLWAHELNKEILITYYLTGFPVDCIHAAATWIFLWFGAEPMLEKLDRIKVKYGLVE